MDDLLAIRPRLVEEGRRLRDFASIDFRDSTIGRQAQIQGSTLAVWEVQMLLRCYRDDVSAVAKHLRWPESKVQAAVAYAEHFRKRSTRLYRKTRRPASSR
jgi:hypothetical protein